MCVIYSYWVLLPSVWSASVSFPHPPPSLSLFLSSSDPLRDCCSWSRRAKVTSLPPCLFVSIRCNVMQEWIHISCINSFSLVLEFDLTWQFDVELQFRHTKKKQPQFTSDVQFSRRLNWQSINTAYLESRRGHGHHNWRLSFLLFYGFYR